MYSLYSTAVLLAIAVLPVYVAAKKNTLTISGEKIRRCRLRWDRSSGNYRKILRTRLQSRTTKTLCSRITICNEKQIQTVNPRRRHRPDCTAAVWYITLSGRSPSPLRVKKYIICYIIMRHRRVVVHLERAAVMFSFCYF